MSKLGLSLIVLLGLFAIVGCDDEQHPTAVPSGAAATALASTTHPPSVQVSAGGYHTCVLGTDGAVRCFGLNNVGQAPALKTAASGTFTQVSAGDAHTCAVRSDGVIECWGRDDYGQAPESLSGSYTQVSAGDAYTCFLQSGHAWCLGAPDPYDEGPYLVEGHGYAALGDPAECGLRTDGQISCLAFYSIWDEEWQDWYEYYDVWRRTALTGTYIQVSGHCALRSDGAVDCWSSHGDWRSTRHASTGRFTQYNRGCGLRDDGVVECGTEIHTPATGVFTQVDVGRNNACALRDDGEIECWGDNSYGQAPPDGSWSPWIPPPPQPPTPTNFSAVAVTQTRVSLAWTDATTFETSFVLERRTLDGAWQSIDTLAADAVAFSDTTVAPHQRYHYRIAACHSSAGCSPAAQIGPVSTGVAPPAPTVSAAPDSSGGIGVTWTVWSGPVSQVHVERIIKYQGPANDWRRVLTTTGGHTRYDDPDVVAGTTYRYRVMACNIDGCSPWAASPEVVGPGVVTLPLRPSYLRTYSFSPSTITLWWPSIANATRFTLSRRRMNADGTWSGWTGVGLGAQDTSHIDTGLAQGTYHYRLRACNVAGCSDYSGSSVRPTRPATPTSVRATATSPSTIRVTWTDMSSTETHFSISRSLGGSSGAQHIASAPANSTGYDDGSVTPGTTYEYRIRACNASGCSPAVATAVR